MKKVRINGQEYTAETAVALIGKIKGMHWQAGENATAKEYIAVQEDTYQRMTGRRMKLPDTGTEDRAAAMFHRISEIGAWDYEDTDAGKDGSVMKKYYFAYGSNCNLNQMAFRCPKATVVGPVTLRNYRLTFNGKSNGWGVANVRRRNGAQVTGLLWEITPECEKSLDRYEGYPYLYGKKTVTVRTGSGQEVKAMVYVMIKGHEATARPSSEYFSGIVEGFQQNGMETRPLFEALKQLSIDGAGRG